MKAKKKITDAPERLPSATGSVTILSEKLHGYRGMLWTRSKARKPTACWLSDVKIHVGELCWRPLGNSCERYRRISEYGMQKLKSPNEKGQR